MGSMVKQAILYVTEVASALEFHPEAFRTVGLDVTRFVQFLTLGASPPKQIMHDIFLWTSSHLVNHLSLPNNQSLQESSTASSLWDLLLFSILTTQSHLLIDD